MASVTTSSNLKKTKTIPNYFSEISFKKKIIYRIVASVKYFIAKRDVKNAEAGLITIFNVIGYISSEFIGVQAYLILSYLIISYINTYKYKLFLLLLLLIFKGVFFILEIEISFKLHFNRLLH